MSEEEIRQHHIQMMEWAQSLTKEQIDYICDGGWYNNAMRGYLITVARHCELDRDKINEMLQELSYVLDEMGKDSAEKIYRDW